MTSQARKQSEAPPAFDALWADDDAPPTAPPTAPEGYAPRVGAGRYSSGSIISGKYQLLEVLGEGGMGSVWVTKNRTLDVEVALKLMRAEIAEVEGVAERMLQEARAAACIGHPAIIQVFDFGFSELGDPFIVMERLRGESLASALERRGRVQPARALQTVLPIVDALSAAHARGIVHRDMKPENIFLARPPGNRLQPKVLDFGIAKLEQRAAERLTRDGAVIGSPAYMSPEQLRGEASVDARADIWALTVVLYEMVTGHRPFEAASYHASMWNVLNAEPRSILEHGVEEPELWSILEQGLRKDANARYPSMRALGRDLAGWLLVRGIQEDICDAALRPWLMPDAAELGKQNSFFPSQDPAELARPNASQEVVVQSADASHERSGTRPTLQRRVPTAIVKSPPPSVERRALYVTLACAALAFVGAAIWAAAAAADGSDAQDSKPVSQHTRRSVDAAPRSLPPAALSVTAPDRAAPPAPPPQIDAPRPRAYEAPAQTQAPAAAPPPRSRPQRAPLRRAPSKADLKNPFG